MHITSKVIVLVVSAMLMASGSSFAATAEDVKPKISTDGLSEINFPPDLISSLAAGGVTLNATGYGKVSADGSTGYTQITFPVIKPIEDGLINHRGVLEIVSAITEVTLTLTNPKITYDTDGSGNGALGGVFNGIPAWMAPFDSILNGTYLEPFDLANVKTTVKKGKVAKKGKGYIRKDLVSVTGSVLFTDRVDIASLINTALVGATRAPLLTRCQALGNIGSKYSVTTTCKTMKACKG